MVNTSQEEKLRQLEAREKELLLAKASLEKQAAINKKAIDEAYSQAYAKGRQAVVRAIDPLVPRGMVGNTSAAHHDLVIRLRRTLEDCKK